MNAMQTFWLGVVQGLTEFLPVSSDGHLALLQSRMPNLTNTLALDVALHVGTLASILIFFRREWMRLVQSLWGGGDAARTAEDRRQALLILAVTVPTGIVGLLLKPFVEAHGQSLVAAGFGFLVTAAFLFFGERSASAAGAAQGRSWAEIPFWHAAPLGIMQGLAVLTGVSRSGLTISTALMLGWGWEKAGPFSFLAAIPAICGATLLTAKDMTSIPVSTLAIGIATSFAVGCLALALLMKFLAARKLRPFAIYCAIVGTFSLLKGWHVF